MATKSKELKGPSGMTESAMEALSRQQQAAIRASMPKGGTFVNTGYSVQPHLAYRSGDTIYWIDDKNFARQDQTQNLGSWQRSLYGHLVSKLGLKSDEIGKVNGADLQSQIQREKTLKADNIDLSKIETIIEAESGGKEQKSLISIWGDREDLQAEFPDPLGKGVSGDWTINDWWNQHGVKEFPDIELVQPDQEAVNASSQGGASGGTPGGTGGTGSTGGTGGTTSNIANQEFVDYLTSMGIDPSQIDQNTLAIASVAYESMKVMEQSGQVIDPELEITEENANEFLSELEKNPLTNKTFLQFAQKELGPYYNQQIAFAKQDLERNIKEGVTEIGEQSAEAGLAFSGRRIQAESDFKAASVRPVERSIGSASLGESPLYTLSGGIEGELEKEREVQEKLYAQNIEGVYRQRKAGRQYI